MCWKQATGLPEVFNPKEKPWIRIEGAGSARIVAQVEKCPSGALGFYYNEEEQDKKEVTQETRIEITPNGPLLVYGNITLEDKEGNETHKSKVASRRINLIATAAIYRLSSKVEARA